MAAHGSTEDGLSTIGEIKFGSYLWVLLVFVLSGFMAYTLARYDRKLFDTKNKYIDPEMTHENRLSSSSMPHTSYDARTDVDFTKTVERLSK